MRILACVKRVPAPGARIKVADDGQAVETAHLGFTTSPHEECAVEAAVQLVEANEGTVTVLTLGPSEAEEQLRYAASVGANEIALVSVGDDDPLEGWDPQRTSKALADAINNLEQQGGPFDLILFGNESADSGGYQVGVRVAHQIGRPMINGAKAIEIDDDQVVVRRAVDNGFEVFRLPSPCVVGVKEGINLPRYPTMKGRLASKKVALSTIDAEADAGGQVMLHLSPPEETESDTQILGQHAGSVEEMAVEVVDLLEEIGLL